MCHSTDSRAPGPPEPGEVAEHGPLELESADGTRFSAYRAVPAERRRGNVVLLPDVRGLHPFYEDLAQRFAEAGYQTVAIDYFGRTAGTGARGDDFQFRPHVDQVQAENVTADVAAAVAYLREQHEAPTFTVGFCFGGSQSWRQSAADLGLAGCIGFYGRIERFADVIERMRVPLLLLVAGADAATPVEDYHKLAERFDGLGTPYEMHVYDGAPHSFFDRSFAEWQDACADAWRRILAFTDRLS
jgi:carboxymethylenebutenolidase